MFRITKLFFLLAILVACSTFGIPQEKLTPALWKRIEDASPRPLPQTPAVKRETSDAQDEGLKGRVKRVIREYRSYTDVYANRGRVLSSIDEYDAQGNLVREIQFANGGELSHITVYGYIDGFRASLYRNAMESANRFTVAVGPVPQPDPPTRAPDNRYTYKLVYTYQNGRLSEMRMFDNDGAKGMYYKYTYSPTERSETAFTDDDQINWRYIYKLDSGGNSIGEIAVDVRGTGGDTTYRVVNNSIDRAGNWTHNTRYQVRSTSGKTEEILISETFRTITYY